MSLPNIKKKVKRTPEEIRDNKQCIAQANARAKRWLNRENCNLFRLRQR